MPRWVDILCVILFIISMTAITIFGLGLYSFDARLSVVEKQNASWIEGREGRVAQWNRRMGIDSLERMETEATLDSFGREIQSLKGHKEQSLFFQVGASWITDFLSKQVPGWLMAPFMAAIVALWLQNKKLTKYNQELTTNTLGIAERLATLRSMK